VNLDVDKGVKPNDYTFMELEEYGFEYDEPNDFNMGLPNTLNPIPNQGLHDDDNLEIELGKALVVRSWTITNF